MNSLRDIPIFLGLVPKESQCIMLHKKVHRKFEKKKKLIKMGSKLNFHVQFCNTALLQRSVVNMGSKIVTKCQKVQKIGRF